MSEKSFYLGCAIWSYPSWVGDLYPPRSRPADFLSLYSQRFTAVEGNTTFYAVPDEETVARWREETPPDFLFFPKLPRDISHHGPLLPSLPAALRFLKRMQGLGSRLGTIFVQLPPSYSPERFYDLRAFLRMWPRKEAPIAVEVRHPGWFSPPFDRRLEDLLSALGVGTVLLDTRPVYSGPDDPQAHSERKKPALPVFPKVTAAHSLIRFISHPERERNQPFLEEWVGWVDRWCREGVQVSFFVHCPMEERSPGIARHFQRLLEERGASVPPLPWNNLKQPPEQLTLL